METAGPTLPEASPPWHRRSHRSAYRGRTLRRRASTASLLMCLASARLSSGCLGAFSRFQGLRRTATCGGAAQPDLWDAAPHVPQGLRDIVNKSIAREPVDRYASAAELDSSLGGWSPPSRHWTRVKPHPGHEQCFRGAKGTSLLEVCAIPTGVRTQLNIVACHTASRRAVPKAHRTVPRSGLSAGLRSAFHACS